MRRTRRQVRGKRRKKRGPSAASRKETRADREPPKAPERLDEDVRETLRAKNAKVMQKRMISASDGQVYYKTPGGPWIKTIAKAVVLPDGTLRALPPDPRPTKRERAKEKRLLKRKEK